MAASGTNGSEMKVLADIAGAMRTGNLARASELADVALANGLVHPLPYQARAVHLDKLGKGDEALENFSKAQSLAPNDAMVANGLAICLGRLGRLKEAMAVFETALALDPNLVTTYFHMGWVLEMHLDFAAARRIYKSAVERAPQYAAAWAGLASAAERCGEWKEAQAAAKRALAIDPHQPRVIVALASAEIQGTFFAAAEARLRAALGKPGYLTPYLRIAALGHLADALDAQDKTAEAFAFYTKQNLEKRAAYVPTVPALDMAALVNNLTAYFERTYPDRWLLQADSVAEGAKVREHVFLIGFPRSGTTLLEQVLAAHPDVATLEESDALNAIAERFLADDAGLDRFASLGGDDLQQVREEYWQRVGTSGLDVKGKVFVDKLPLNTIKLPLIAKLFPKAKALFAVRDPRDVVFSCFRRPLPVSASTYEFLALQGAAQFYDSVMALGEMCREKLPLPFHIYRHEDLVRDFEGEVRRLCAFIGIEWIDGFRDFAQIAQQRNIRSISAAQVRRGLYGDGAGQWRRYAAQLDPILPILQRWVEKFGYEPASDLE